jgi:hypothetical protein
MHPICLRSIVTFTAPNAQICSRELLKKLFYPRIKLVDRDRSGCITLDELRKGVGCVTEQGGSWEESETKKASSFIKGSANVSHEDSHRIALQYSVGGVGDPPTTSTPSQIKGSENVLRHSEDPESGHLESFLPYHLRVLDECFGPCRSSCPGCNRDEVRAAAGEGSYRAQAILSELQRMHRDAPDGLHFIAFAAGFMMSLVAVENFWSGVMKRSVLHAFFAAVVFMSGLIMVRLFEK